MGVLVIRAPYHLGSILGPLMLGNSLVVPGSARVIFVEMAAM